MAKKFVSLGVPEEVKHLIKKIAKRERMKIYETVEIAIRQFLNELTYKRGEKRYHAGYTIDRDIWYAFKLVNSVAQLKMAREELNGEKVEKYHRMTLATLKQISERLNLDTKDLERAIDKFLKEPTGINKANVNDKTKVLMARIILRGG